MQRFRVTNKGGGVFGAVAKTLGSRGLTGSVELGALWSALPDVPASPEAGRRRLAMRVIPPAGYNTNTIMLGAGDCPVLGGQGRRK